MARASNRSDIAYLLRITAKLARDSNIAAPDVSEQFLGTWFWDIQHDQVYIEPLAAEAFGLSLSEAGTGLPLSRFAKVMHGDDVDRVMKSITETSMRGGSFSEVYRTVGSGEVRTILAQGFVTIDAQRRAQRFTGALFDISKKAKRTVSN